MYVCTDNHLDGVITMNMYSVRIGKGGERDFARYTLDPYNIPIYLIHQSACSTWWSSQNKGFVEKKDMKFLQVQYNWSKLPG
jgi:hypothetical protein